MKCSLLACLVGVLVVSSHSFPMLELKPAVRLSKPAQDPGNLAQVAESLGLTTLVSVAKKYPDIVNLLVKKGVSLTLFGPTNEAFNDIPEPYKPLLNVKDVLLFHVIKSVVYANAIQNELLVPSLLDKSIRFNVYGGGKVVTAQCSVIIKVNQNASNGVIHVVKRVMIPPFGTVTDVVAMEKQYFSTLLTAVLAANLQGILAEPGPFTVFAPTNEAFAKIPAEKLKEILKNIPLLTKILKYHVVSRTYCSAGLVTEAPTALTTLEGSKLPVQFSDNVVTVGNAHVVFVDIPVSNGVVHVIDTVLIPKAVEF